jgi:hypothetical protein
MWCSVLLAFLLTAHFTRIRKKKQIKIKEISERRKEANIVRVI